MIQLTGIISVLFLLSFGLTSCTKKEKKTVDKAPSKPVADKEECHGTGDCELVEIREDEYPPVICDLRACNCAISNCGAAEIDEYERSEELIRSLIDHIERQTVNEYFAEANEEEWGAMFPSLRENSHAVNHLQEGEYSLAYKVDENKEERDRFYFFMTFGQVSANELSMENTETTWERLIR